MTNAFSRVLSCRHPLLRAKLRRLLRSNRGSVSVEVAIIVPLMVLLMAGFSEIYLYMRAVSIMEHTAFTLADSIGQMPQVIDDNSTSSANNLGSIWKAATLLAAPNTLQSGGGVIVTSVCDLTTSCVDTVPPPPAMAAGTPLILWQKSAPWNASGMTTRVTASNILPATWPFRNGDSAVVVELFLSFNPFAMTRGLWPDAPGTQTIYERVYVRPRFVTVLKKVPKQ
jgi:Flp pilus assembly protein TadG